jgi:hypothetical protein
MLDNYYFFKVYGAKIISRDHIRNRVCVETIKVNNNLTKSDNYVGLLCSI